MTELAEVAQSPAPDPLVELFTLDASDLGDAVYRFCSSTLAGGNVVHDGNTYTALPIEAEGFSWNGRGPLPKPKLRLSNIGGLALGLVIANDDMLGATVTRLRTFKRFLDGQAEADPDKVFSPDIYQIERMATLSPELVEWELSPKLDQEGRFLPGWVALRDICLHVYRVWNPDTLAFDYSKATCPFAAASYFDTAGNAVAEPAADICNKRLTTGCKRRFGANGELPFRGFPSLAKVRTR